MSFNSPGAEASVRSSIRVQKFTLRLWSAAGTVPVPRACRVLASDASLLSARQIDSHDDDAFYLFLQKQKIEK